MFSKNLLVFICRALPILGLIGAIYLIVSYTYQKKNWETADDSLAKDKKKRVENRGTFVSVCSAILLNVIGSLMAYLGVKEGLIVTNYGFILGPVIGFMLDQGIGLDSGLQKFKTSIVKGLEFSFSSLATGNFLRYIVTVFLDLFISNPLQDVLKSQANEIGIIQTLQKSKGIFKQYDKFIAMNFPSILQSIVGFITFQAYTNQTRFAWAYPATDVPRDERIPPGTIMLSTAIAGVLYLTFYKMMDYIFKREYFDINTKLLYVVFAIIILYGLNQYGNMEAELEDDEDDESEQNRPGWMEIIRNNRASFGIGLFIIFVLYGLVYPFSTVLSLPFGKKSTGYLYYNK